MKSATSIALFLLISSCMQKGKKADPAAQPTEATATVTTPLQGYVSSSWGIKKVHYREYDAQNVLIEGDVMVRKANLSATLPDKSAPLAVSATITLWEDSFWGEEIPYLFAPEVNLTIKQNFKKAVDSWNSETATISKIGGIQWKEITSAEASSYADYIYVTNQDVPAGAAGASYIGKIGGKQSFWLLPECELDVILHEMGHAMGLEHEHVRPDRDQYIAIDLSSLPAEVRVDWDPQYAQILEGQTYGPFDFDSIMLYPSFLTGLRDDENVYKVMSKKDGSFFFPGWKLLEEEGQYYLESYSQRETQIFADKKFCAVDKEDLALGFRVCPITTQDAQAVIAIKKQSIARQNREWLSSSIQLHYSEVFTGILDNEYLRNPVNQNTWKDLCFKTPTFQLKNLVSESQDPNLTLSNFKIALESKMKQYPFEECRQIFLENSQVIAYIRNQLTKHFGRPPTTVESKNAQNILLQKGNKSENLLQLYAARYPNGSSQQTHFSNSNTTPSNTKTTNPVTADTNNTSPEKQELSEEEKEKMQQIETIFSKLFEREPTTEEISKWTEKISTSTSQEEITKIFASAEFTVHLQEVYTSILNRAATEDELQQSREKIQQANFDLTKIKQDLTATDEAFIAITSQNAQKNKKDLTKTDLEKIKNQLSGVTP